jgi:hypothetical protein
MRDGEGCVVVVVGGGDAGRWWQQLTLEASSSTARDGSKGNRKPNAPIGSVLFGVLSHQKLQRQWIEMRETETWITGKWTDKWMDDQQME